MKLKLLVTSLTMMGFAVNANAQSMWGTGMYGGMQSCPYNVSMGEGASSALDDIKELESSIKEMQRQLQTKKREKKKIDKQVELSEKDIKSVVSDEYADFALEHMQNARQCSEYKGLPGVEQILAGGSEGETPVAPVQNVDTKPFQVKEWASLCDPNKSGTVFPALCDGTRYRQQGGDSRGDVKNCKKGLSEYRKNYSQAQKLQREIDSLERSVSAAKDSMKDAKQAMIDEQRSNTEGGVCVNCVANSAGYSYQQQNRGTDWANVAGNIATGLIGMYAGYKSNQMVAQYNSNLGFPTTAYPTIGYGLPYIAAGLYGALGGGTGQGGFGCGGSGANGAFGYPNGMYGGMAGGGMYMPGAMMMGMMSSGYMMGMMNGMMASGGMMMSGYPMGMMMAGYPMGMMMNGGLMASGGMMMPGMMMPGMMASGMMANMMGMMNGMMMSGGLMMNGGMMMDSSMSQMQMQMMQMQMQQYQSYMQQQMQRQQTVAGLQQELYSLLYRIQQVQYGAGITGTGYIGGSGTSGGAYGGTITGGSVGTGSTYNPYYPGNGGTATTPLGGSNR